jgi:hypothetical protein
MFTRIRTAILAAVAMVSTLGCSPSPSRPPALPSGAATQPSGSSPAAVTGSPARGTYCRVETPPSWQQALAAGRVPVNRGDDLLVKAASPDGTSLFAQVTRPGWRGLVWLQNGGTTQTTVMTLADPVEQQFIDGGFDGRWLVFAIGYDRRRPDDWTVHAWDSTAGGLPWQIADNRKALKSPWIRPVVHRGKAAWIAGAEGLQATVHLYDLASSTDRIVHSGPATGVFFLDSWLVWRDGYETDPAPLRAVDIDRAVPVGLPPVMQGIRSLRYANGNGTTVIWVQSNGAAAPGPGPRPSMTLMAWRPAWDRPQLIVTTTTPHESIEWPYIASDLVSWGNLKAFFIADLRTRSYAQITPQFGAILIWGDTLMVHYYRGDRRTSGDETVIRASQLPSLPTC